MDSSITDDIIRRGINVMVGKAKNQERSFEECKFLEIYHLEPLPAIYCWEMTILGEKRNLKFHKNWVCEENQCAKLCQNPWTTDGAAKELLKIRAILLGSIF